MFREVFVRICQEYCPPSNAEVRVPLPQIVLELLLDRVVAVKSAGDLASDGARRVRVAFHVDDLACRKGKKSIVRPRNVIAEYHLNNFTIEFLIKSLHKTGRQEHLGGRANKEYFLGSQ